jgi:YgiT-type zinc finger domain-containing protein
MSNNPQSEDVRICDNCGAPGARIRYVSRSYGKGEQLLVIENVPVISCPSCGESYLTALTLHAIEQIKRERQRLATTRPVAVAEFATAA